MKTMKTTPLLAFFLVFSVSLFAQPEFHLHNTGMTGTIRGLHAVSKKVIWISGTKGEFSRTCDGGKTWFHSTVPGGDSLDFRDVQGFSAHVALLMSAGSGDASSIYRTENGGKSWCLTYQNTNPKAFFDGMDFPDANYGLIIGDPVDQKPYILETTNGGRTWSRLIPSAIPDLIPGEYAFAASGTSLEVCSCGFCCILTGGSAARVFRSSDRGNHWEVSELPLLKGDPAAGGFSIALGTDNHIAVAGGNYQVMTRAGHNIALSDDAGLTWNVPSGADSVPFMECVRWINAKTLIATGPPGVWLSKDAGSNWKEISRDGFHTMDVVPGKNIIWLAGNKGKVVSLIL
jgi:photosystem II stability/assembly factor-like uncharacterized protein